MGEAELDVPFEDGSGKLMGARLDPGDLEEERSEMGESNEEAGGSIGISTSGRLIPTLLKRSTQASALSRLSLNTAVTERNMSKLSAASVRIFCAACCIGTTCPLGIRECEGEVALEAGREREEGPGSPGP